MNVASNSFRALSPQSSQLHSDSSAPVITASLAAAAAYDRHLDDVSNSGYDVIGSRCDVRKDVVLPPAFVRRRNERERHRVR